MFHEYQKQVEKLIFKEKKNFSNKAVVCVVGQVLIHHECMKSLSIDVYVWTIITIFKKFNGLLILLCILLKKVFYTIVHLVLCDRSDNA